MNMWNPTYEVDSESAVCVICGIRLNTQTEYKIHHYFKFRTVNAKLTRLNQWLIWLTVNRILVISISELESLGLETAKLNELNDSYEVENLVENIKQSYFQDYKSLPVYSDWVHAVKWKSRLNPIVCTICNLRPIESSQRVKVYVNSL